MGIKRRNLDEQVIILRAGEPVAADNHVDADYAHFNHFIKNIHAEVAVVGATATTSVDLNRNLVSVLAATIDFTADLIPTAYPALTATGQVGSKGDRYSLDVDAVETTPPQGLTIHLTLARKNPGAVQNVTPANLK